MNTDKPFELTINLHGQYDIIDHIESREKNAIYIYNDLGPEHYSAAPALCDKLNALIEENQALKKENMEYYQLVRCDNCRYHNYDWFDDGDEFEVCDRGNTERLMYHKFCKEWEEL